MFPADVFRRKLLKSPLKLVLSLQQTQNKMGKRFTIFIFLIMVLTNPAICVDRSHIVIPQISGSENINFPDNDFDYQTQSPFDFLEMLKSKKQHGVFQKHIGWIKKNDIPKLIQLLDSKEKCGAVAMMISSYFDVEGSTVGAEAAFLIDGFRINEYPPYLNSPGSAYNEAKKQEILDWWEEFKTE